MDVSPATYQDVSRILTHANVCEENQGLPSLSKIYQVLFMTVETKLLGLILQPLLVCCILFYNGILSP